MTIRTPDDEVKTPGYFYPPFREGWWYQGATYPGHSDASVDWNRRTKTGGWLDDTGDPVLAAADGTVAEVDPREGLVYLHHFGGLYRTEYRHMTGPFPKVGDKVQRGDRIGSIGNVAGDGRSFGAHLHHVHWKRSKTSEPFQRTRMRFYGKPVEVSVPDSDTRPSSWNPPEPVMVQGPPPKATWETAYKEAIALAEKRGDALEAQKAQTKLATDERDAARAEARLAQQTAEELRTALTAARSRIAELEAATPPDCSAIAAERDAALAAKAAAEEALNEETDRAVRAEAIVERVRQAVTA